MKQYFWLMLTLLSFVIAGCAGNTAAVKDAQINSSDKIEQTTAVLDKADDQSNITDNKGDSSMKSLKLRITAGDKEMIATLEDNAATRALVKKLPMTLPMQNLYSREMCYRYGARSLPTENLRSDRYEVGDIVYWPPRGSFVILYAQNGEEFERQQIGHIDCGAEVFKKSGDVKVTFELVK